MNNRSGLRTGSQENVDPQVYTLTVAEAAEILGRSVDSVRRYIRTGMLPSGHVAGTRPGEYRLRPEDVSGFADHLNQVIQMDTMDAEGEFQSDPDSQYPPAHMHALTPARMQGESNSTSLPAVIARLDEMYREQLQLQHAALRAQDQLLAPLQREAERADKIAAERAQLARELSQQTHIVEDIQRKATERAEQYAIEVAQLMQEISRLQEMRLADRERAIREAGRYQDLRRSDREHYMRQQTLLEEQLKVAHQEIAWLREQLTVRSDMRQYFTAPSDAVSDQGQPPTQGSPRSGSQLKVGSPRQWFRRR